MLAIAAAALAWNAPIAVRKAEGAELRGRSPTFSTISRLTAAGFSKPGSSQREQDVLASALARDMLDHFSSSNRNQNALLLAEDSASGEIVGAIGVEVLSLSKAVLDEQRSGAASMDLRPLVSNLAVDPAFRRRGIAKQLCRGAEREAKSWGFREIVLKVEADNAKARSLYRAAGYRVVATDREAQKPEAGLGGVRFVPTTQVAMRKDLVLPPLDTAVLGAAVLGAAVGLPAYYEVVAAALGMGGSESPLGAALLRIGELVEQAAVL